MTKMRVILVAGGLVVLGAGGFGAFRRGPETTEVQTATVARQDLQAKVSANGRIQAQKKVDISATIAGQVTHLAVQEGDRVTKGQLLLQIDAVHPRAAARSTEQSMQALLRELDSTRAAAELARADHARARENHRAAIISDAELQRARTALATGEAAVLAAERRVEQARATLEGARDTLSKTTVRAPMDGIVTAKRIEEGEVAVVGVQNQPGTVLLTVSDMSTVEAEMEVDEASIPSVKPGQQARVRIDAYPNRVFEAVVTEVGNSPVLRANGGDAANEAVKFRVKAQLAAPPEGAKPGLSVQADILTGFRARALVVPLQALVVRDAPRAPGAAAATGAPREEEGVYLMEGGKARFRKLATGLLGEMSVEVKDGLKGGETLVVGPFRALRNLKDGDLVRQEKPRAGGATPARS